MKIDSSGYIYVVERPQGNGKIYRSTNNGNNWEFFVNGSDITFDGNGYFYRTEGGSINKAFRSIDGGTTWVDIGNLYDGDKAQIEIDTRGDILLGDNLTLKISDDFGNNWEEIFSTWLLVLQKITKEDHIYISGAYSMWETTDFGVSWKEVLGVPQPYNIEFNSFGDIFILSWGNGIMQEIYKSTDNGANWNVIFNSDDRVSEIFISDKDQMYVAVNSEGIYRTLDGGENWETVNSGLVNYFNYGMTEDEYGFLYVSTFGDGIFKSVSPISTIRDENNIYQYQFNLFNNYPNPFNPTTTIKYQISELSYVTLKVYDVLGNEILKYSEEKATGYHRYEFDATGLPSGIYFYRLQAKDFVETKKMVLLK